MVIFLETYINVILENAMKWVYNPCFPPQIPLETNRPQPLWSSLKQCITMGGGGFMVYFLITVGPDQLPDILKMLIFSQMAACVAKWWQPRVEAYLDEPVLLHIDAYRE